MIFGYKSDKKANIHVFNLQGELIDREQGKEMLAEIELYISKGENKILLDLNKLEYMNSNGLNVLINILTKTRKSGGETAICSVNKKISELLVITKLDSIFNVCDDEEDGLIMLSR